MTSNANRLSVVPALPQAEPPSLAERVLAALEGMLIQGRLVAGGRERSLIYAGDGAQALCGWPTTVLTRGDGLFFSGLVLPEDRLPLMAHVTEAAEAAGRYRVDYRITHRNGSVRWVSEQGAGRRGDDGVFYTEAQIKDITDEVRARQQLADAELRYRSIFDSGSEGLFQTSMDGLYLAANPALATIYGYSSPAQLIAELRNVGRQLYVDPERRSEFTTRMQADGEVRDFVSAVRRRDGSIVWISESAHSVCDLDGNFLYYEGSVRDVTAQREAESRLRHQATRDQLTGLFNRSSFAERFEESARRAERRGEGLVIAFIDLDNFKVINDSLGHLYGDKLLLAVSHRLSQCLRATDVLARYGGDEFVLMLEAGALDGKLEAVLARVQESIARPILLGEQEVTVTSSIGIAHFPDDARDLPHLLQQADAAMYAAKAAGRARVHRFTPEIGANATARLELEMALRSALERKELSLVYQPRLGRNGELRALEALLRWQSTEFGAISPVRFIPIAEETGLIVPITDFVIEAVASQLDVWRQAGLPCPRIAINCSVQLFRDGQFAERLFGILDRHDLPHRCIELEITETQLMADPKHMISALGSLKARGLTVAVDDFGTGYSSLAYLKSLPIDVIKIDKSFVDGLGPDTEDFLFSRAIISLGHSLGLEVVAEGVETGLQYTLLRELGCDEFQGYRFDRPLVASAIAGKLREMGSSLRWPQACEVV
ncbi:MULTISPECIES: bifunctional diguanylate cyclase/phosphodiesterase [Zoogloea]|uniref:putative bifunctional diguanylate cyclase/phosphodiesterase n=1 Tax=Zoogloea TaxID=349 RepID=UPI0016527129|nr:MULTISPECIES: bifunctional diguanylate cyclase/phosphodiesterase [Zoogloea]MBT9499580.1 EAL domain-containing protein [Zoogloea sp.]MDD2669369.1 EAL domain-containing protein [Zoogloea sp.]MDY0037408.1 EAL domain-containing protein [Zoogloea oleivorans]